MKKKYYHATAYKNLGSILERGLLKSHIDGIVYLCDTGRDAKKFPFIRGVKDMIVIEVELDEEQVTEQFDHDETFFNCKAYGYPDNIPFEKLGDIRRWQYGSGNEGQRSEVYNEKLY